MVKAVGLTGNLYLKQLLNWKKQYWAHIVSCSISTYLMYNVFQVFFFIIKLVVFL